MPKKRGELRLRLRKALWSLFTLLLAHCPHVATQGPMMVTMLNRKAPSNFAVQLLIASALFIFTLPIAHASENTASAGERLTEIAYKTRAHVEKIEPTKIAWDRLEWPMLELRARAHRLANDKKDLAAQDFDHLEAMANEAVITKTIAAIYTAATSLKWTQAQNFKTFSMSQLLSNSAREVPSAFNPNGLRIGLITMKLGKTQRGVLLSTSFMSDDPLELRSLYRKDALVPMIDAADSQLKTFASDVVGKFTSFDSRKSRYVPVSGKAQSWSLRCDAVIAAHFCLDISIFDSGETDPRVFADALGGISDANETVRIIRALNLTWPVQSTYISRGLKPFGSADHHYGLDLTAPIGTPVRAVMDGTIMHAKGGWAGWGNAVMIEHKLPNGGRFLSLYAHLSKIRKELKPGDTINRGDIIALTGQTGSSAQGASIHPHLHLEIREIIPGREPLQQPRTRAEQPIDPLRVLDIFNLIVGT